MRTVLVLAGLAAMTAAHASFEMMLIADPYGDQIIRYDQQNGVMLGSFGHSDLGNPTAVVANSANGIAYVADVNGGILQFNYSTGQLLAQSMVSGMSTIRSMSLCPDGNLMVTDGAIVRKISSANSATIQTVAPYLNNVVAGAYERPGGGFWMVTNNASLNGLYITYHTAAGQLNSYYTLRTNATGSAGTFAFGGMDFRDGYMAVTVGYTGTSFNQYFSFSGTYNANGVTSSQELSYPGQNTRQQLSNPVFGHSTNAYYVQAYTSGGNNYSSLMTLHAPFHYDSFTNFPSGLAAALPYGAPSVAMVLAPEPAPMMAFSIGTLAIFLKRRKK